MNDISIKDKVFMENEKIKVCNEISPKLKTYFGTYLNEKICLVDGSLLKKIKDDQEFKDIVDINKYLVKPLPGGHVSLNLFMQNTTYNLLCNVKLCFNGGSYDDKTYYCVYTEKAVYVGKQEYNHLLELEETDKQSLIDAEYQEKQIALFKIKATELKEIRDNIYHSLRTFIRYDLVN